jgi:hypothetical protein
MTHEEVWEVAREVGGTGVSVGLRTHDDQWFYGLLMFVNDDYLVLDGQGFPLEDVRQLGPQYVNA